MINGLDKGTSVIENYFELAQNGSMGIMELIAAADRLISLGQKDSAKTLYRKWVERASSPLMFAAYFNLGVLLGEEKDHAQAEAMYKLALELKPNFLQAQINLGSSMENQGRTDETIVQWEAVLQNEKIELIENRSLLLHALNNLGRLLESKRLFLKATEILERSIRLDPDQNDVILHLTHLRQKQCVWPIMEYLKELGRYNNRVISPMASLAYSDDPELQLEAAKSFVASKYGISSEKPLSDKAGYNHNKIRIGYLSSDLSTHAVSLLTVELFELHDREQFEVYGFCWSKEDGTPFRQRVISAFDHFIRLGNMDDIQAAKVIRENEIDILVDLQGLTSGARPLIMSYRPAPLQITYLGFPGPTGLPWIDYVIADRYLIPEETAKSFTEKPLYLPGCFQVSDSKREIASLPTRTEYSLPDGVFVFCSFNNNYKYTPEMFTVWMRILKKVPKSVLWLLADNEWAHANLIQTASKHGIKKERLIFAPRELPPAYLARYQLADLFLDTFPFNGGTTANDALFMGLPLLSLSGRTFASRMAGSLLTNLGLPELISNNLKEYEEKAVRFAKKPAELKTLKERLKENKVAGSVFDIPQFVEGYERMIAEIHKECSTISNTVSESTIDNKEKPSISMLSISNPPSTKHQAEQCLLPLLSDVFVKEKRTTALSRLLELGFLTSETSVLWEENFSKPIFDRGKEGGDEFLFSSIWIKIYDEMEKKGGELTSIKSKIITKHVVSALKVTGNTHFFDYNVIKECVVLDYGAGIYSPLSVSIILYANGFKQVIAHEPFPIRLDYAVASVAQTLRWLSFEPQKFIFSGISSQEVRQRLGHLDFENIEEKLNQLISGEKNYIDFNGVALSNSLSALGNDSIDLLFSHSVLEYVQNLKSELQLHWNLLRKDAKSVHIVDFLDYRAIGGDPNVFQMYYDGIFAEGINGLRPSEMERLFASCQFQGSKINLLNTPKNLIDRGRVIERYAPFSDEELSTWVNYYVLSKQTSNNDTVVKSPVSNSEIIEIYKLIWPLNLVSDHKIRMGSEADGGYILPSFARDCNRLLSIGIGVDVSFDEELANLGATVIQFDHTIERSPVENQNFEFHRIGWGEQDKENLLSLRSMISMIDWKDAKHPIMKFDVEFAEWATLAASASEDLARFEIITGEFHGFQYLADRAHYELFRSVFEKLAFTHYPVHLRGNNAGGLKTVSGVQIPQFLEITYLRKDMGKVNGYSTEAIPGPLDKPNYPQLPDIVIQPYFDLASATSEQFFSTPELNLDRLYGPIEWASLSEEIQNRFTLNRLIPVQHWFIRENSPGYIGKNWHADLITNGILQASNKGELEGIRSYDKKSIFDLYKIIDRYSVKNKDVLVIGSQKPWIEVICLAFGAKSVTTVDFNPPVVEYPAIRTVSVSAFEKESIKYDILLSFSSLEHDGLGRYGDPVDPDGDIIRMNSYRRVLKSNGFFCLGVPCGMDVLYWNAHRIYGEIRFPMLTASWNTVDFYMEGTAREDVFNIAGACDHAWWVLKPL